MQRHLQQQSAANTFGFDPSARMMPFDPNCLFAPAVNNAPPPQHQQRNRQQQQPAVPSHVASTAVAASMVAGSNGAATTTRGGGKPLNPHSSSFRHQPGGVPPPPVPSSTALLHDDSSQPTLQDAMAAMLAANSAAPPPPNQQQPTREEVVSRTVHLRFLPVGMRQGELYAICSECGPLLRVRICGGQTTNAAATQNWIYGFVEFQTPAAAQRMLKRSGMELHNGSGKPPLRLKCHMAREPIVDRVFHDADPAKGFICQFGQGAFANRTLKEALDSYFSLVSKCVVGNAAASLKDHVTQFQQHQAQLRHHQQQQQPSGGSNNITDSLNSNLSVSSIELLKSLANGGQQPTDSVTSSINGRTPTLPPSPQMQLPPSAADVDFSAFSAAMRGGSATPPPLPPLSPAAQPSGPKAASNTSPIALIWGSESSQPRRSPSTATAVPAPASPLQKKLQDCVASLESAMRSGSRFAAAPSPSQTAPHFVDAMKHLHAVHEALNNIQKGGGAGDAVGPDAVTTARSRAVRISAYLIAAFLHKLRGAFSEMLPCLTKAMDVIASVPFTVDRVAAPSLPTAATPHPNPANPAIRLLKVRDDDDDDDAFLAAVSLVHMQPPAAQGSASAAEHGGSVRFARDAAAEGEEEELVQHQVFLIRCLLAIGFTTESLNPLIARCAYTAARRRANTALGTTIAALDKALGDGGVHDLRFQLLCDVAGISREDVHEFAAHFFRSYPTTSTSTSSQMAAQLDAATFFSCVPPQHCLRHLVVVAGTS